MPRSDRDAASLTRRTAATRHGIARHRQAAARTRGLWWRAGKAVGRCRSNSHCNGASAISDDGTRSGTCDSDSDSTNSYAAASASAGSSNSRTRCARADAATTARSAAADNRTNDRRAAKQRDRCAARPAFDNAARIGQSRG
jgi:hypothetical protein